MTAMIASNPLPVIAAIGLNKRKKEIKWLARAELELREKFQFSLVLDLKD